MSSLFSKIVTFCLLVEVGAGQVPEEPLVELLFNDVYSEGFVFSHGRAQIIGEVHAPALFSSLGHESVSGRVGDFCFDNTGANGMADLDIVSGIGRLSFGNVPALDSLSALTISLWYRTDQGVSLNDGGGRLIDNGRDWLVFSDDSSRVRLEIDLEGESSGIGNFTEAEQWVFLAITFDADTDTAVYYKGTKFEPLGEIVTRDNYTQVMPGRTNPFLIGNNEDSSRSFDGYVDNVRVWDSALTERQLEEVRRADLSGVASVNPTIVSEFIDAGDMMDSALSSYYVSDISALKGSFNSGTDVDMFRLSVNGLSEFQATVTPTLLSESGQQSAHLFLFSEGGELLGVSNLDDADTQTLGELSDSEDDTTLYFFAVAPDGVFPESESGTQVVVSDAGEYGLSSEAAFPFVRWNTTNSETEVIYYDVKLEAVATVQRQYELANPGGLNFIDGRIVVQYLTEHGKQYDFRYSYDLENWDTQLVTAEGELTQFSYPHSQAPQAFHQLVGPLLED